MVVGKKSESAKKKKQFFSQGSHTCRSSDLAIDQDIRKPIKNRVERFSWSIEPWNNNFQMGNNKFHQF
jgi:hypothetical protein